MPQAVHVQIVRQIALLQNLFEPECECTRHPRIPAGLPKQIVLFLQPPFTTLFFLPPTFLTGSERHTSLSSVFGFGLPHAEKYRSLGISEEIFPDTMGCFSAFAGG